MRDLRGRSSITRSSLFRIGPLAARRPRSRLLLLIADRRLPGLQLLQRQCDRSHQSITRSHLEKKRWPPMSMRLPL